MKLYRPVGLYEMEKILNDNGNGFPPRFSIQPIFYPVLNLEYAQQIAKEWNQKDIESGYVGFVTEFEIDDEYFNTFEVQCVGGKIHQELWVPSEELSNFNSHLQGPIKIKEAFYGELYQGVSPKKVSGFKEENKDAQIACFKELFDYNRMDFSGTVFVESTIVNLNYLYWKLNNENKEILVEIKKSLNRNNKNFIVQDC